MSSSKRSPIWNFFTPIDKDKAKCDLCSQKMSYKSSTSNMKRHVQRKHPTVKMKPEVEKNKNISDKEDIVRDREEIPSTSSLDQEIQAHEQAETPNIKQPSKTRKSKQSSVSSFLTRQMPLYQKKKIDHELLLLFALDYQPFRIVEDRGFRRFVNALNPAYTLPNRQTISKTSIPARYETCLQNCRKIMEKVQSVCLTTDCWTSINNESFIAITAHFITGAFLFKSMLLKCGSFSKSHTSANLADSLRETAKEWDIENKIILTVSDNASNIKKAISEDLGWKHFGCFAHLTNLIVQSGLKKVIPTIDKVKDIVTYF
nr:PREDICTED: zinc finger BED domain-containing protein 4-like [Tribolium castaneum]XP_015839927.1 PREDICTED: zinc finger BED domain-containing protein 4-like [Tribolium castaneum]|eukprot:XP_015839926.1 PREDICTED: zinc finger BED domain-containing protein 4-like [Tribolium castaneum]